MRRNVACDEEAPGGLVRAALEALGVERLALGIHDPAFPSAAGEETGRGAPASRGGTELLRFVAELGFDTVQLGPRGLTTRENPSPYDGALFSRDVLSIDLCNLATSEWGSILQRPELQRLLASVPQGAEHRVPHAWVFDAHHRALGLAWRRLREGRGRLHSELRRRFAAFRAAQGSWLRSDLLYQVLADEHGSGDWRRWPTPDRQLWCPGAGATAHSRRRQLERRYRRELECFAFGQWMADEHHRRLRLAARALGLDLFGDFQVGVSARDHWRLQGLFLDGYLLGAPPSRTNPEGQPWGYPVLDPGLYFADGPGAEPGSDHPSGPVLDALRERLERAFSDYDGLRIDHPHGLVCPWVYRADAVDPSLAVRQGARLFSSPDLADHPALASWAIARPEQLARAGARWADDWESGLTDDQVERLAPLIDLVITVAREHLRGPNDLMVEVLSTLPNPLARVLDRHRLGRLRVTPKAELGRPEDPYRSDQAQPGDWIVLGNHDTRSLWGTIEDWRTTGQLPARIVELASTLAPDPHSREALHRQLAADPRGLAQALLADALASRAGRVALFFTDLLGMVEPYNRPGTVEEGNWSLRIPPDYRERYAESRAAGEALDLHRAAALALRARFGSTGGPHADLLAQLEQGSVSSC